MNNIQFKIERLDRFAQGITFSGDHICFIKRVLPKEEGIARVIKKRKGVLFAEVLRLEKTSSQRSQPACDHYDKCQGCQYLHISYKDEISYKLESFRNELGFILKDKKVESLFLERFFYRNRIQLHYHKKNKKIGFLNSSSKKIIEVQNCLLPNSSIQKELKKLYGNNEWLKLVKDHKNHGHIELYEKEKKVITSINKPYAQGGFTQVNPVVNEKLGQWIIDNIVNKYEVEGVILDLFGGGGNLSSHFQDHEKVIVDLYDQVVEAPFYHLNLDSEEPFFIKNKVHLMIIDPPRRGFKNIKRWVDHYNPEFILYVSCDISTLKRDVRELQNYELEKALMIDFFGGTFHYESLVFLRKNR